MNISEILTTIESELAAWAKPYKGSVHVAGDPVHLFALLAHKPGSFRVGILFKSEVKRGEYEEAGFVDRSFLVVLSRGRGFTVVPGDALAKPSAGGLPLFDLCELAREVVRAINLDEETTEATFDYKGTTEYQLPVDMLVDAYQLEISIGCQLPAAGDVSDDLIWDDGSDVALGTDDTRGLK